MRFTPQSQSSFGSLMYTATPTTCDGSRSATTPSVANGPFLMPSSLALISRALGSHGGSATVVGLDALARIFTRSTNTPRDLPGSASGLSSRTVSGSSPFLSRFTSSNVTRLHPERSHAPLISTPG